ncbi:hypothetical protein J3B02_006362, partial [Coemansia erecta]
MDSKGVLGSKALLEPVFPGVASALARVALAQLPNAAKSSDNFKKPTSTVRALAITALRKGMTVVYQTAQEASIAEYDEWAGRSKNEISSIVLHVSDSYIESDLNDNDNNNSNSSNNSNNERQLLQILWRLAGLRHSEHPSIKDALLDMFASVSFDCLALQSTPCLKVALETGLVISMLDPSGSVANQGFLSRLSSLFANSKGSVQKQIVSIIESSQLLFEQYIGSGSDEKKRDVLCLLAGSLRVAGQSDAKALTSSWWSARGLRTLLSALSISLPGTSLLITDIDGKAKESDNPSYVLDGFRSAELERALLEFIDRIAKVFSPSGL